MSNDKVPKSPEASTEPTTAGLKRRDLLLSGSSLVAASALSAVGLTTPAQAQQQPAAPAPAAAGQRPNIVVIMGDDIGIWNIGAYHRGMMAGRTPNLDKLAKEGMLFTDYYAEASCTAGRANFITGQLPIRTGMTTVGQAGAKMGLPAEACTIATALKAQGYATGQFGKNHLGDRNEFLPTVHGFDEFFGYLYHLDAMEDPAHPEYPQELLDKVGPRNMVHSWATDTDDATVDPRWGKIGRQKIQEAGMAQLDDIVGNTMQKLKDMGVDDNTIVVFTTDNGTETFTWPDGGNTPFKGQKGTIYEGGFRAPAFIRWPGKVPAGTIGNGIVSGLDWLPTFVAAAGNPNISDELLKGKKIGDQTYKNHLDGYNQLAMITGKGPSN